MDYLARRLVDTLPSGIPNLFNPWKDHCPDDLPGNGPDAKYERLVQHLDCQPDFIQVGEAIGYAGCRHSGIAFTSERLLIEGAIPRVTQPQGRLTSRDLPFSEPSATIVWKSLYRIDIAERTILWNALQMHPHKPDKPNTNRTPSPAEIALGEPALRMLMEAFPQAKIVAIGKKSAGLLQDMGVIPFATVRHPANGGASKFAAGQSALIGA